MFPFFSKIPEIQTNEIKQMMIESWITMSMMISVQIHSTITLFLIFDDVCIICMIYLQYLYCLQNLTFLKMTNWYHSNNLWLLSDICPPSLCYKRENKQVKPRGTGTVSISALALVSYSRKLQVTQYVRTYHLF